MTFDVVTGVGDLVASRSVTIVEIGKPLVAASIAPVNGCFVTPNGPEIWRAGADLSFLPIVESFDPTDLKKDELLVGVTGVVGVIGMRFLEASGVIVAGVEVGVFVEDGTTLGVSCTMLSLLGGRGMIVGFLVQSSGGRDLSGMAGVVGSCFISGDESGVIIEALLLIELKLDVGRDGTY